MYWIDEVVPVDFMAIDLPQQKRLYGTVEYLVNGWGLYCLIEYPASIDGLAGATAKNPYFMGII